MPPHPVRRLRRRLHQVPRPAHDEGATAQAVRAYLADHGREPIADDVGGHGLLYRIGRGEPVRLLRADLDALPWPEESGVRHAARGEAHHACGHDGHMAMLAGALAALDEDDVEGTVYALFQPAEETGEGMARCLEHDAMDIDVDACFAIHNIPGKPLASVVLHDGVAAVASTGLVLGFEGSTSHAAEPYRGRNPIPVMANLIHTLEAAPSRYLPFDATAMVAIVGIEGGGPHYGTSAGEGRLMATLRAGSEEDLDAMIHHVAGEAQAMAAVRNIDVHIDRIEPFPATFNDRSVVEEARDAARRAGLSVEEGRTPFPWSEDFGHATKVWPGCLIGLGAGTEHPALHSPRYDFPDELLGPGVDLWTAIAKGPGGGS